MVINSDLKIVILPTLRFYFNYVANYFQDYYIWQSFKVIKHKIE
jgi:hypothetical protein